MLGRSINVQLVKNKKAEGEPTTLENLDYEKIGNVATDVIAGTAIVVVLSIGAVIGMKTISQIAVNVTNPKNWR